MAINLVLAEELISPAALRDQIEAAMLSLMVEHGLGFNFLGTRSQGDALTETVWTGAGDPSTEIRLMHDSEIPALWLQVKAAAPEATEVMAAAFQRELPVRDFESLRKSAGEGQDGALCRLVLSRHASLAQALPPLVKKALGSNDISLRTEAAMASHMSALKILKPLLLDAIARETDPNLKDMLEFAAGSLS